MAEDVLDLQRWRSAAIPVLAFKVKDPSKFTVFHVSDQLRTGGWQVPA